MEWLPTVWTLCAVTGLLVWVVAIGLGVTALLRAALGFLASRAWLRRRFWRPSSGWRYRASASPGRPSDSSRTPRDETLTRNVERHLRSFKDRVDRGDLRH